MHPSLVGLIPASVPRPLAVLLLPIALGLVVGFFGRMIFMSFFRLPLTRGIDKLLGAAPNGGLAFVIVYSALLRPARARPAPPPRPQPTSTPPHQLHAVPNISPH